MIREDRLDRQCANCPHDYGKHSKGDTGPCVADEGCDCEHFTDKQATLPCKSCGHSITSHTGNRYGDAIFNCEEQVEWRGRIDPSVTCACQGYKR